VHRNSIANLTSEVERHRQLGRTATGAVPRLENGWGASSWGFDSLSFRSARRTRARRASPPEPRRDARLLQPGGMAESARQRVASAQTGDRPQVRVLLPPLPPRSSVDPEQWASNPRAPVRVGPGRFSTTHHPRVAQQRRAPLLQRGGWGFESLAADHALEAQLGRAAAYYIVGEPMVPPRAPSFVVATSRAVGPLGRRSRPSALRVSSLADVIGLSPPLKLSSAEQPPCKRTVVGSIPTWGSSFPS
jgi:hypothetical protein